MHPFLRNDWNCKTGKSSPLCYPLLERVLLLALSPPLGGHLALERVLLMSSLAPSGLTFGVKLGAGARAADELSRSLWLEIWTWSASC